MRHFRKFYTWPADANGQPLSEHALLQRGMVVVGQCLDGAWLADCNYKRDPETGRLIPPEERSLPGQVVSKGDIGHPTGCRCEGLPEWDKRVAMPEGRPRFCWSGERVSRE